MRRPDRFGTDAEAGFEGVSGGVTGAEEARGEGTGREAKGSRCCGGTEGEGMRTLELD